MAIFGDHAGCVLDFTPPGRSLCPPTWHVPPRCMHGPEPTIHTHAHQRPPTPILAHPLYDPTCTLDHPTCTLDHPRLNLAHQRLTHTNMHTLTHTMHAHPHPHTLGWRAPSITGVWHGQSALDLIVIDLVFHATTLRKEFGETYALVRLNEERRPQPNGSKLTFLARSQEARAALDPERITSNDDTHLHPREPHSPEESHQHGLRALPLSTGVPPSNWRKAGPTVLSRTRVRSAKAGDARDALFARVQTLLMDVSTDTLLDIMSSSGRGVLLVLIYDGHGGRGRAEGKKGTHYALLRPPTPTHAHPRPTHAPPTTHPRPTHDPPTTHQSPTKAHPRPRRYALRHLHVAPCSR